MYVYMYICVYTCMCERDISVRLYTMCALKFILYYSDEELARLTSLESCTQHDKNIRLVSGSTMDSSEGTVEICIGVYVPVCGFNWDMFEAEVVCRQLGFQGMHLRTCILDGYTVCGPTEIVACLSVCLIARNQHVRRTEG